MSSDLLKQYEADFQAALGHLKEDLKTLRTGRATPALIENIQVEAYGARTPLVGLASITVPDARSLVIDPWDKGLIKEIEKAILEAKIGLTPSVQGKFIRISMPPMTEESRKELIKIMNDKLEQARIAVRGVRETAKADIVQAEKDKAIAEDDKYRALEQLDKQTAGWNEKIKNIGVEKEKEIMTL